MKQPLRIFQLIPSKRDLQFPGVISKKTLIVRKHIVCRILYIVETRGLRLGVSSWKTQLPSRPMEQAFPIHSSCKSCRLERVFKLPFPLL